MFIFNSFQITINMHNNYNNMFIIQIGVVPT